MFAISRTICISLSLLFSAAVSACVDQRAQRPEGPDREADEAAIRAQVATYQDAVNRRDGTALGNLYTSDGDLVMYDSPRVTGRDSIAAFSGRELSAMPATQEVNIVVTNIRFVTPDMAIVETVATLTEGDVRENRGTAVMLRENGQWMHAALRVFLAQRPQ